MPDPEQRMPAWEQPQTGKVRTPLYCHGCDRNFEAVLDFDCDGNHVIFCPHCRHEHCRVIRRGVVTGDRWDSRNGALGAVWYANTSTMGTGQNMQNVYVTGATAGTAQWFIRSSWTGTSGSM